MSVGCSRHNSSLQYLNKLLHFTFSFSLKQQNAPAGFHFFKKVQDLPTRGAFAVEHFTINGTLFLAFANYHGDINKHKTSSMIYKMDGTTTRFALSVRPYKLEVLMVLDTFQSLTNNSSLWLIITMEHIC